ncbi:hypothetical protein [Thalassotalea fusca]
MKFDDLKQNWQESIAQQDSSENLSEVIAVLATETKKLDNHVKYRDILEISIAIFLIPFWVYGLMNSVSTMQSLGCILAIISSVYIPYRLIKAKKVPLAKDNSVREYLLSEQQKVAQQKALLESIVWWYITPITVSVLLITLGANVDASGLPQINQHMMIYYASVALLVVGIYLLNMRAAKKRFGPILEKIEERLAELES